MGLLDIPGFMTSANFHHGGGRETGNMGWRRGDKNVV